MNVPKITEMKVSDLAFDLKNPRLPEFNLSDSATDKEVIKILWDAMDVKELVLSIGTSGFFRHEPVIVEQEDGKNIVIEGNRRLAAVKVLLDPALLTEVQRAGVPRINREAREALQTLPAVLEKRKRVWRYLGFKHVNGPAKWSSYAKARYIAEVHTNYDVSLEDIANQIGDTHKTVQRLFQGLMIIEQAEKLKVFNRDDRWNKHFSFSHLYTGVTYSGISAFIGLQSDTEDDRAPVPPEKKKELGELCLWLYGSKRDDKLPVVQKQNPHLRYLDAVVASKEAIATLRAGDTLDAALEVTRPSSAVFEDSLFNAKQQLQTARGMLSTGYDNSGETLKIAGTVANLADDLYREMERKHNPGKKQRIAEDN